MSFDFSVFSDNASTILDAMGVAFIFGGAVLATLAGVATAFRAEDLHAFYRSYRHNLARSIVTGLDFLVAGDIIRTVGADFPLSRALSLALIVFIRIIISMEFEFTLYGRWPWSKK